MQVNSIFTQNIVPQFINVSSEIFQKIFLPNKQDGLHQELTSYFNQFLIVTQTCLQTFSYFKFSIL